MKTVILAAGLGTRLGNLTKTLPKCLLEVDGKTIIESQVELLNNVGIEDIIIVVGYKSEMVKNILGDRVSYITNKDYEKTNSSYSLWLAKDLITEGWLHMNCDLIFSEKLLQKMLLDKNENSILVDMNLNPEDDQEKVRINNDGIVTEMSKTMPYKKAHGKTCGMAKFSETGASEIFSCLDKVIQSGEKNRWFFSFISDVLSRVQFKAVTTDNEFWAEVDTPQDLEYARKNNSIK